MLFSDGAIRAAPKMARTNTAIPMPMFLKIFIGKLVGVAIKTSHFSCCLRAFFYVDLTDESIPIHRWTDGLVEPSLLL